MSAYRDNESSINVLKTPPATQRIRPLVPGDFSHDEIVEHRLGWIVAGVWIVAGGVVASFIATIVISVAAAQAVGY